MSSNDHTPQLAVLKRGKRQVATQLKNDFCRAASSSSGAQQLDEILNFFIDCDKPVEFETTDWCRYLISGGTQWTEFSDHGKVFPLS